MAARRCSMSACQTCSNHLAMSSTGVTTLRPAAAARSSSRPWTQAPCWRGSPPAQTVGGQKCICRNAGPRAALRGRAGAPIWFARRLPETRSWFRQHYHHCDADLRWQVAQQKQPAEELGNLLKPIWAERQQGPGLRRLMPTPPPAGKVAQASVTDCAVIDRAICEACRV